MDFEALESVEASSWEARWALRQALSGSSASSSSGSGATGRRCGAARPVGEAAQARAPRPKIEVLARHALTPEISTTVVLPNHARYRHVKRALAELVGDPALAGRLQVLRKRDGVYAPYQDKALIREVRQVLLACPGLDLSGLCGATVSLGDEDVTDEEPEEEQGLPTGGQPAATLSLPRPASDLCPVAPRSEGPIEVSGLEGGAAVAEVAAGARFGCTCGHRLCEVCGAFAAALGGGAFAACRSGEPGLPQEEQEEDDDGIPPADPAPSARPRISGGRFVPRLLGAAALAAPAPAARVGLSRQQALALQRDLHAAFAAPDFQGDLQALAADRHSYTSAAEFAKARQALLLRVQRAVLPQYGFDGSPAGVIQMMGAMAPFVRDGEIQSLAADVNALIGIHLAPEKMSEVSRQCRAIRMDPAAEFRKREQRRLVVGTTGLPAPPPIPAHWRLAGRGSASSCTPQGPAPVEGHIGSFLEALPFDRWASPFPPFHLSIAGSWNQEQPQPMTWMAGLFMCPASIGPQGKERFQLLLGGNREQVLYPSVGEANHLDDYVICGPDDGHAGRFWLMGKGFPTAEDGACPDARFAVVAALDVGARVKLVGWQQFV